jgi:hypothetical protein
MKRKNTKTLFPPYFNNKTTLVAKDNTHIQPYYLIVHCFWINSVELRCASVASCFAVRNDEYKEEKTCSCFADF